MNRRSFLKSLLGGAAAAAAPAIFVPSTRTVIDLNPHALPVGMDAEDLASWKRIEDAILRDLMFHKDLWHEGMVRERLERTYPETWGARGDGVTDDTLAFRRGILFHAKGMDTEDVPAGLYERTGAEGTIRRPTEAEVVQWVMMRHRTP